MRFEPSWSFLHEDRGRALLATSPADALAEFDRAACGSACSAEAGDALMAMGCTNEAVDRYVAANAVGKVNGVAASLAGDKHYRAALGIESALAARLQNDALERADLASVLATMGKIELEASASEGRDSARNSEHAAIEQFAEATRLAPLNEGYLLSYAFAQMQWGDKHEAERAFERLLEIHPGQTDAEIALARLRHDASAGP